MTAYYNEIDPYAAQWLRNLIKEGLIADGEVDTRSIVDVRPADLAGFEQCHFFAGLGGWSGALRLAGVADTKPLWTGSCPCQPFSLAGKQKGFNDDRHLWPVWRELIRERRPARVFGEQVASASAWLGLVRGDLEAMGYAVGAIPVEAASSGADHLRDRYWFVANSDNAGSQGREVLPERADQRAAGPDGLAAPDSAAIRNEPRRSGGANWPGAREHRDDSEGYVFNASHSEPQEPESNDGKREQRAQVGGRQLQPARIGAGGRIALGVYPERDGRGETTSQNGSNDPFDWVVGADGKARRVKPGIRLLAHGVPARVAKLRALGNAIDLRPAAAFIGAAMSASQFSSQEPR